MDKHGCVGELFLEFYYAFGGETLVDVACAVPEQHVAAGAGVDVCSEVAVGTEYDFGVGGHRLNDFQCIARCDEYVGEGLYADGGVDVGYYGVSGVIDDKSGEVVGVATVGKRASGVGVGEQDGLVGAEEFDGFGHEVHAAHHNGACVANSGGFLRQSERIADIIGDVLKFGAHIVMGQYYGFFLLFEAFYIFDYGSSAVARHLAGFIHFYQ